MRSSGIRLGAVLACAVIAGCGGSGDENGEATASAEVERAALDAGKLTSCPDEHPDELRCGRIDLPLERADPERGTISIRYAVLPRSRPGAPEEDPIMAVEGGPGYGSVGSANAYSHLFGGLLRTRDLIVVDMRGTGGSGAIDCPDLQRGIGPPTLDLATCARSLGADFESYRTSAAADDLDDVRRALGHERITLYGDSYGTYLAQSYAFRHPEALGALVLDSAYPVRGESGWYPSVWRSGIRNLGTACRRSPDCPPGSERRLREFVGELRKEGLGVGPLLDAIGSAGFSPPRSFLRIDKVIASYLNGDRRPYERLAKIGRAGYGDPARYSFGQELTISCNDYPMIWDKEASENARREQLTEAIAGYRKERFAPFTPGEIALSSDVGYLECLSWPAPGPNYEPPAEESDPSPELPTLVVAGELDNVTSPEEARHVAADFPNSKLFIARNDGHVYSLYDSTSPEAKRIRAFIRNPPVT